MKGGNDGAYLVIMTTIMMIPEVTALESNIFAVLLNVW